MSIFRVIKIAHVVSPGELNSRFWIRAYLIYEYSYLTSYFLTNGNFDLTNRLFSGILLLFVC